MDDAFYASLLRRFRDRGYDTGVFRRVAQVPEQVGREGFQ